MSKRTTERKFDDFFNAATSHIESIDILIDWTKQHDNVDSYKPFIFCPDCKKAQLTFVHGGHGNYFLRTKTHEIHDENCYYYFEHIATKSATAYFKDLDNQQIQSKLASMMRILSNNHRALVSSSRVAIDNPFIIQNLLEKQTDTKTSKTLRRQKLSGYINESIENELHIFYGEVRLAVKEKISKKGFKYFELIIMTKNKLGKYSYRTKLYRGSIQDNIDENKQYYLVFIGTPNFQNNKDNTGKFLNIELISSNAVLYKLL